MKNNGSNVSRREFIQRSVKAGTAVAFAGAASYFLYDSTGPGFDQKENIIEFPKYNVPDVEGKYISIVKGKDRSQSLKTAISLIGGIRRFVMPGDRVIIKPNIAFATSPDLGATSHPDIISSLIQLCYEAGAGDVAVMDNPINDPAGCYMLSGIKEAAENSKARLLYPDEDLFQNATLKDGQLIRNWPLLYKPLKDATRIIGVSPIKNHHRSGASMSMKNWYGLLGGRRNIFHQDINTIIAELAMMIKPTLVILDGFNVMMTNGPTGGSLSDLKQKNTIIASTDQVAADSYGATLLGMGSGDLPYIGKAEKAGAGTADYKTLKPLFSREV